MKDVHQKARPTSISPHQWALVLVISSFLARNATGIPMPGLSSEQMSDKPSESESDLANEYSPSAQEDGSGGIAYQKLVPPREQRRPIGERDHYFRSMKRSAGAGGGGDHYFRSLRESPDHYFRSLRDSPDHYFRSLRSDSNHYFRSMKKRSGGGDDHYFRSLRDSPDHYFRSLRDSPDHYFRSLRSDGGNHYFRSLRQEQAPEEQADEAFYSRPLREQGDHYFRSL